MTIGLSEDKKSELMFCVSIDVKNEHHSPDNTGKLFYFRYKKLRKKKSIYFMSAELFTFGVTRIDITKKESM